MKYKIEKNTVQETLIIPLYGRKMCSQLYPSLYRDETALRLMNEIDYDFSLLEKKSGSLMQRFGFLEAAMRQNDLAFEVRDHLKSHPKAAVVNLGCGLDSTGRNCDNGSCRIYNLDFPDVIAVRKELLKSNRSIKIPAVCGFQQTAGIFIIAQHSLKQKMSPGFTGLIFYFVQSGLSAYGINKFIYAAVLELEGACTDFAHLIAVIECPP